MNRDFRLSKDFSLSNGVVVLRKEESHVVFSDPACLAQNITETLLDSIEKSRGSLSSFSWEKDELSVSVCECSPELIASAVISSVSYEKDTQVFTVHLPAPKSERTLSASLRSYRPSEQEYLSKAFVPLLRREVFSNRGEIKTERVTEGGVSVSFSVPLTLLSKMLWSCSYQTSLASLAGFSVWENSLSVYPEGASEAWGALVKASWQLCPDCVTGTEKESSVMNALSKYAVLFKYGGGQK